MSDPYRELTEDKPKTVKELGEMSAGPETKEQPFAPETPSVAPSQEQAPAVAGPVSSPPSSTVPPQTAPAPLNTDLENDRQLKILVDLAFSEGIDKAVQAARSSENPYLIDKFHDTLVDELRQKLLEKGKLKET